MSKIYSHQKSNKVLTLCSLAGVRSRSMSLEENTGFDIVPNSHIFRDHIELKGQNSRTFQGLLKDLKLQFSSTKSIDKKTSYPRCDHNHITFKTNKLYVIYIGKFFK